MHRNDRPLEGRGSGQLGTLHTQANRLPDCPRLECGGGNAPIRTAHIHGPQYHDWDVVQRDTQGTWLRHASKIYLQGNNNILLIQRKTIYRLDKHYTDSHLLQLFYSLHRVHVPF